MPGAVTLESRMVSTLASNCMFFITTARRFPLAASMFSMSAFRVTVKLTISPKVSPSEAVPMTRVLSPMTRISSGS